MSHNLQMSLIYLSFYPFTFLSCLLFCHPSTLTDTWIKWLTVTLLTISLTSTTFEIINTLLWLVTQVIRHTSSTLYIVFNYSGNNSSRQYTNISISIQIPWCFTLSYADSSSSTSSSLSSLKFTKFLYVS